MTLLATGLLLPVLASCDFGTHPKSPTAVSQYQSVLRDFDDVESLQILAVRPDPKDPSGASIEPGEDGGAVLTAFGVTWAVAGPLVISGDAKKQLWSAVRTGLSVPEPSDDQKACVFSPRHAIVLEGRRGRTTMLLCYECGDVWIQRTPTGEDRPTFGIEVYVDTKFEPTVTRLFEEAGLAIAD